jgi:O-antigen/teichoic acid export membrane protein
MATKLRELTDPSAYRAVAAQAKYPVAAMLVSQTLAGPVTAAVLSRTLGSDRYGEFTLILTTIAGYSQLIAAFPVETGLAKFLAEARQQRPEEVRAWYAAGLCVRLAAGVLGLLVAVVTAGWLSRAYGLPEQAGAVVVAAISACLLTPLAMTLLACVQGMEQPARWSTGNLVNSVVVFALIFLGARAFGGIGQRGIFAYIALGWLAATVVCAVLARRALGFLLPARPRRKHLRVLLPYLLPMWIVPLAGFATRIILRSVLAAKCGRAPVGQFEIALTLLIHMGAIYQACMIVFIPVWTRLYVSRQGEELLRSTAQARGALLGVAMVYGAILVVGGRWLVPAIFGEDQVGAVPAVAVMGLTMPIMIAGWVASATNVVSNRTRNIGVANVIWFSLAIPLGIALTPSLGSLGTALAWMGAYCVFAWYYVSRARPFFREVEGWKT